MAHHYRSGFEWFDDEGPQAQRDLEQLVRSAGGAEPAKDGPLIDQVRDALDDDLNTPRVHQLLLKEAQAIEKGETSASPGCLVASAALCGIELR